MMNERDSLVALKDAEIAKLNDKIAQQDLMIEDYQKIVYDLQNKIELLQANLNVSMGKPDMVFDGQPTSLDIIMADAKKENSERGYQDDSEKKFL